MVDDSLQARFDKLAEGLAEASSAFETQTEPRERLFALMRAVSATARALRGAINEKHLRPLTALIEALEHLSQGGRDSLLRPAPIANRPQTTGTRIIEQAAGVVAARYFRDAGLTVAQADQAAAKLLASHGIVGKGRLLVSRRTIADWRLGSVPMGNLEVLRDVVERIYDPVPDGTDASVIKAMIPEIVANLLATRHTEKKPE